MSKYFEGFTALYNIYFLAIWRTLNGSRTSTPVLNIPLGNSPVMLIFYTVFGIGMILGIIALGLKGNIDKRIERLRR